VWTETKVLYGLTGVLGATEEEGVGAGGGTDGDLVNGEAFAASLLDTSAGGGGETEGRDGELGELYELLVPKSYVRSVEEIIPKTRLSSVTVPTCALLVVIQCPCHLASIQ
jgi:hypothetical protein